MSLHYFKFSALNFFQISLEFTECAPGLTVLTASITPVELSVMMQIVSNLCSQYSNHWPHVAIKALEIWLVELKN